MEEKKILVTRSSMPPFKEYVEAIRPLWDSVWLTNMGKNHQELMGELAEYLKVPNVSLFVNGHMALELCIQAMGLTGEVITTPFTFVSTTHAIIRNGLTPVFCDINAEDYTIDVDQIESLITDQTSAIIPVHVYGNVCNVEKIEQIAKKHGLKVLYDAAHAFGVKVNGRGVGNFGDASMFSFHATKVFHTIEGGAITTADEVLDKEIYKLKDFGIKNEEIIDGIGANAKMNEFQAVMGLCNLKHVEEEIAKRKAIVERYRSHLGNKAGIKIISDKQGIVSNYAYFPVVFDENIIGETRDDIYARLKKHNVYTRKYFYPLTNDLKCFEGRFDSNLTPVAKQIAERVLTLPMAASLTIEDADRICSIILDQQS